MTITKTWWVTAQEGVWRPLLYKIKMWAQRFIGNFIPRIMVPSVMVLCGSVGNVWHLQHQVYYIVDLGRPAGYLLTFLLSLSGDGVVFDLGLPVHLYRALEHFFFLPISRGNWATWISGNAKPSQKSSNTRKVVKH
jgi:hypothetical protein